jgi:hypothetical protein
MLELLRLLLGVLSAALRSHRDLVLENLLLRHQLAVAARPKGRPRLRTWDKLLWLVGRRPAPTGAGTWSWSRPRRWSGGTEPAGAWSGAGSPAAPVDGRA